jgi:hypothetical protein
MFVGRVFHGMSRVSYAWYGRHGGREEGHGCLTVQLPLKLNTHEEQFGGWKACLAF